jgi:hypothetical protein
MILTAKNIRDVELEDRRVLGAFRLVDGLTGAPLVVPAIVTARSAAIIDAPPGPPGAAQPVTLGRGAIDVRQNRRGWFVIFAAPLFDTYTHTFLEPANPPELPANRRLRLRFAITDAGPNHLPRFFDLLLPRSLDPADADSVFAPQPVELLRAPAAPIPDGWATLRVRVRSNDTAAATLPGALVRVFRSPRSPNAPPIGVGLTEWRDAHLRGEAVVPIPGLLRFTPGSGANVLETTHAIELVATRDQNFPDPALRTPPAEQLPDVDTLIAGVGPTIVRRVSTSGPDALGATPAGPHTIAAGEELALELAMP